MMGHRGEKLSQQQQTQNCHRWENISQSHWASCKKYTSWTQRGRRKYIQAPSPATWEMWGKARWKIEGYSGWTESRLATEKHREKVQDTGNEENPTPLKTQKTFKRDWDQHQHGYPNTVEWESLKKGQGRWWDRKWVWRKSMSEHSKSDDSQWTQRYKDFKETQQIWSQQL